MITTNTLMLIAVVLLAAAIITSLITDNSWKNVGICWSLLALRAAFLGIALTL